MTVQLDNGQKKFETNEEALKFTMKQLGDWWCIYSHNFFYVENRKPKLKKGEIIFFTAKDGVIKKPKSNVKQKK